MTRASFAFIPLVWSLVVLPNAWGTSDVSGLWTMEYELVHARETRVWTNRSSDSVEVWTDEIQDEDVPLLLEVPGSARQRENRIEGTLDFGDDYGGEYTFEGTISNSNEVTFEIVRPARTKSTTEVDDGLLLIGYHTYGEETTRFTGVYDDRQGTITGGFNGVSEPSCDEHSIYDSEGKFVGTLTIETTKEEWSGKFSVKVVKPWVLIHGWKAGPDKWTAYEGFLQGDDIPYAIVDLRPDVNPYVRARALAQEIDMIRVARKWEDMEINLVAHSQGGLDARRYLHIMGAQAKVHSLVMIGTPNHGTVLAWLPILGEEYLTPRWVNRFNGRTGLAAGVGYYTLPGSKVGPLSWLLWGEDDGIVPVSSVRLSDTTPLDKFPCEHNELVTDANVYQAVKAKIDPPDSEEPDLLAFLAIEDGEVLPGQTVSQSIIVDDVNDVAFVLTSGTSLGFTLQSPSGESIAPQSLGPNSSYDSGGELGLLAQSYVVRHPTPGVWTAHVSAGAEAACFTLLASAENTFVLDGTTDEYFNPSGIPIRVKATLGTDAIIEEMQARITGPNLSEETVLLYDDGLHADDLPADGLYANTFSPSLEGEYTLTFSTKGTAVNREFSRATIDSVRVVTPQVFVQRIDREEAVDLDSDGLFEHLLIVAVIDVERAGEYCIDAILRKEQGDIARATPILAEFAPGEHAVEIRFDGSDILSSGEGGPYFLDLIVTDANGNEVGSGDSLPVSSLYSPTEFESLAVPRRL